MSSFKDLGIVDNFYQTSLFYPMPTVLIGTLDLEGDTTLGAYSLCFPYYVAGKSYYAMVLECRNSSNTAQNLLRTGTCSINFLEDSPKLFTETVRLGFPGDSSKEKKAKIFLELEDGLAGREGVSALPLPKVLRGAFQVMECSWDSSLENAVDDRSKVGRLYGVEPPYRNFNGITSKYGVHFILKIDKILMKGKQYRATVDGVTAGAFPKVPVDYGYRDSRSFWYTRFRWPSSVPILSKPSMDIATVWYAADRIDQEVQFSAEACGRLVKIPRFFLKAALNGIVEQAKAMDLPRIDDRILLEGKTLDQINVKRIKEKRTKSSVSFAGKLIQAEFLTEGKLNMSKFIIKNVHNTTFASFFKKRKGIREVIDLKSIYEPINDAGLSTRDAAGIPKEAIVLIVGGASVTNCVTMLRRAA